MIRHPDWPATTYDEVAAEARHDYDPEPDYDIPTLDERDD